MLQLIPHAQIHELICVQSILGMSMFDDWQPGVSSDALSHFWVYWAISIPLTLLVIIGWRLWWRRQESYYKRTYLRSDKASDESAATSHRMDGGARQRV